MISYIKAGIMPDSMLITPNTKPTNLAELLSQKGFSIDTSGSCMKEYRRKGVATITIDKALLDLRKKDVKTISLRAETDGFNVYKRMGFKECFLRTVATCDWNKIYIKACPCHIENDRIEKAKIIFNQSSDIQSFINEMNNNRVIGKRIWYEPQEKSVYIKKMNACDCSGGCPSNKTIIGQKCHCVYVNHLNKSIPLSYCKCAATFFKPIFTPLFGENILIEPVRTVLSGAEECIFMIKLDV